ncbi:MAG: response regulator transcription factor [Roseiflexaceae bacterium]
MRIGVVEDSGFLRDALVQVLAAQPGVMVVGSAATVGEAVALAEYQRPDAVILDLRLRRGASESAYPECGLEVLAALRARDPRPKVLVFSALAEEQWLPRVIHAGADGFVSKDSSTAQLLAGLHALRSGMCALTPQQIQLLRQSRPQVTPRERDVLNCLDEGLSNRSIANRLGISEGTVRKHIENLCTRFAVHSRGQVIAAARREHLLDNEH